MAEGRDPLALSISRRVVNTLTGARKFTDRFVRRLASTSTGKRILEIGSGKGNQEIYPKSYKHYFDPSNVFIRSDVNPAYGHQVVDVTCMDFREEFDIVLCLNVLEHVYELDTSARKLHQAIKPTGVLAVVVPAVYPLHDEPHDYWRFTEHSLRRLLHEFRYVEILNSGLRRIPLMYSVIARR